MPSHCAPADSPQPAARTFHFPPKFTPKTLKAARQQRKRKDSRDDGLNAEANDDDDDGGPTDKRKAFWGTRCGGDGGASRRGAE